MTFQRNFAGGGRGGGDGGSAAMQDGVENSQQPRPRLKRPQTDHGTSMVRFMRGRRPDGIQIESERPSPSYMIDMIPPLGRRSNAASTVPSKHLHSSLNKQKHPINAIKWTPDGRRLLTGNSSGEFTLWNGMGFNFETLMQAHDSAVRAFAWSHDDDWLISADQEGTVKYWQSNFNPVNVIEAHKGYAVRDLAFAPTDVKFVTAADDTTMKIWDFEKPEESSTTLKGHGWDVKTVDWHPTKGLIASGSKDHTVKLWDPRNCRCLTTLTGQATVSTVAFEPQKGNGLAVCSRNNVARVFDLRMMRDVIFLKGHDRDIMTLCWHPIHSNLLSTGGGDGALYHYLLDEPNPPEGSDMPLSLPVADHADPANAPTQSIYPAHRIQHAHDSAIWALDWHPLGHVLASGSNDRVTRFWARARPGDTDCFNDRYHLGEAGAEAHGTWTRKTRRQQQYDDEDQEGDDADEALIDQKMPVARQTVLVPAGLPGLPGLATAGDGLNGAQPLAGLPGAANSIPLPPPSFDPSHLPHPSMLDQMPPEARERFLEMLKSGPPLPQPGFPPPPMPGQFMPPNFAPPPMVDLPLPGQNSGPVYPEMQQMAMQQQPFDQNQGFGNAANGQDGAGRRRRAPLPSQQEMLNDWRRKR